MITFKRYVESKMDKCHLTSLECQALLLRKLREAIESSGDVYDSTPGQYSKAFLALVTNPHYFRYGYLENATVFYFGHGRNTAYCYYAKFAFTMDREAVYLQLNTDDKNGNSIQLLSTRFTDDEMMDFVDYLTYEEPEWID